MDKKQLITLIVVGVLLFLIGGAVGLLYGMQGGSRGAKVEAVNNLSSKVVSSIVAYGQVAKIEGRNITLSYLGDNLEVFITDTARIYSLTPASTGKTGTVAPVQKTVDFGAIKVGDSVNVVLKLSANGKTEGSSVIIFPTPTK